MQISKTFKFYSKRVIERLNEELSAEAVIVLSTSDGFTVASSSAEPAEENKLSAMSSSIAALGSMAGEETEIGDCLSLTIESERGFIVIVEIKKKDLPMTLLVVAPSSFVLARVIYLTRRAAIAIGKH